MGHRVSRSTFIRLKQIEKELGTLAALETLKDGFKYRDTPVLRAIGNEDFEIVNMHWEFIPVWIKDMDAIKAARKQGIPWLNAKSETLLSSKMFRDAALKRRCLVLASQIFEWRHYQPPGEKKPIAYPYKIELKNLDYFFMAGIWQQWTDKTTGETMDTFAIVTTEANPLMAAVHNTKKRMPTILPEPLAFEWIFGNLTEERIQQLASYQLPSDDMQATTIIKNFKAAEDPLQEYHYAELPELVYGE